MSCRTEETLLCEEIEFYLFLGTQASICFLSSGIQQKALLPCWPVLRVSSPQTSMFSTLTFPGMWPEVTQWWHWAMRYPWVSQRQVFPDLSHERPPHGIMLPRICCRFIQAQPKYSLNKWLGLFFHVLTCKADSGGAVCSDVHLAGCQWAVSTDTATQV